MEIILLNGSPKPDGNTVKFTKAFAEGAAEAGHNVIVFNVCRMKISGCMACECCHKDKSRICVIHDDMQSIYPVLDRAEMIVLTSPVYYHGFSGQLQCAINRIYALDKPQRLKKAALLLSSGDNAVYTGVTYAYERSFLEYLKLENEGVFTYAEEQEKQKLEEKINTIKEFAKNLKERKNEEDTNAIDTGNTADVSLMPEHLS